MTNPIHRPRFRAASTFRTGGDAPARRRLTFSVGLFALENRSLLSVTAGPGLPGLGFGDWSVTYPAPPPTFVGPIAPSIPAPSVGQFAVRAMPSPSALAVKLDARYDRLTSVAPAPPPDDAAGADLPSPVDPSGIVPLPHAGMFQTLSKVAMAEVEYPKAGVMVREFAFADHANNQVSIRDGDKPSQILGGYDDGVRRPEAIAMADLDGDQVADLIVANSGANNILIYKGLVGGGFAAEMNGGLGITVGSAPSGITVGDVNGDGIADLIVANRQSNDVTLLMGQVLPSGWSLVEGGRLHVGEAPVYTALQDTDGDGILDLIVCNSGSNNVMVLHGLGGGQFDDDRPKVLPVGDGPVQLFLGRFDYRTGPELLTINSRSNDLTVISDFMSDTPNIQTIASGGTDPTSAFASDMDGDGFTDLVVANSGDGKLAYFQGGSAGLSLTWVLTNNAIPTPTSVLVGDQTSGGFNVYAVSAGQNAASTLHFDLNLAGDFDGLAPIPPTFSRGNDANNEEATAQLISHGDSAFNLVGVLGLPQRRGESKDDEFRDEEYDETGRIIHARAGGQSLDDDEGLVDAKDEVEKELPSGPDTTGDGEASAWANFVLGLDAGLGDACEVASHAIASPSFFEDESWVGPEFVDQDPRRNPTTLVDEAIRALLDEDPTLSPLASPHHPGTTSGDETSGRVEAIPTVSVGLILAHQLLIRVAPSRRLRVRKARLPGGRGEETSNPLAYRFD